MPRSAPFDRRPRTARRTTRRSRSTRPTRSTRRTRPTRSGRTTRRGGGKAAPRRSVSTLRLGFVSLLVGVLIGTTALGRVVSEHPAATVGVLVLLLTATLLAGAAHLRRTARRRRALFEANCRLDQIDLMTGDEFERHVAELLRRDGFRAVRVVGRTADRGADVIARGPDGEPIAVQCKRWRGNVGAVEVRNFIGALNAAYAGHRGVFVASSAFTVQALEEAGLAGLRLVDRPDLGRWLTGEPLSLR
ncbi:restriction endonuclease [Thermomonospora umbrina]|uniref:Restriction system protein n=1 Tax=Thermomonospora umbrina TaxID=111806 RepID=A0A3D9SLP1_9ACTN|nr:restriction endonuclease [Thermomonospora umbrina]REE96842.1 restriction system protein [Thermomonospora umbrina]